MLFLVSFSLSKTVFNCALFKWIKDLIISSQLPSVTKSEFTKSKLLTWIEELQNSLTHMVNEFEFKF